MLHTVNARVQQIRQPGLRPAPVGDNDLDQVNAAVGGGEFGDGLSCLLGRLRKGHETVDHLPAVKGLDRMPAGGSDHRAL